MKIFFLITYNFFFNPFSLLLLELLIPKFFGMQESYISKEIDQLVNLQTLSLNNNQIRDIRNKLGQIYNKTLI